MNWKVGIFIVAVIGLVVGLAVYNKATDTSKTPPDEGVWHQAMVMGDDDAENSLIEYTDYFCQFCADFHDEVSTDKFKEKYIDTGKVNLESRVVTVLSGGSPSTERGAEAAFCAADQDKFYEYGDDIIERIKKDFFEKGIGVKVMNGKPLYDVKQIKKQPYSYFETSAKNIGLDTDKFTSCMKEHTHQSQIAKDTQKAMELGVNGLPYIQVNDYVANGFDGGWKGFETILKAGGVDTSS